MIQVMTFRFNFIKTLQAVAVLLELDGGRMARIRLLKLLYVVDRELLAEVARPLTGARVVAMKYGPVLSQVYDLIKGEATRAGEWGHYIHSEGYAVALQGDPGRGELSRRELEKLAEVYGRYRDNDDWELSETIHAFEEWSRHYREGTSTSIPWQDILQAQGRGELIEIAEREEADRRCLDKLFGV
jgi:uncharacterized phage-associated protein